jgi:hypothetical protein
MANLPMIEGCTSDNMFEDKPDNQPIPLLGFQMMSVLIHREQII